MNLPLWYWGVALVAAFLAGVVGFIAPSNLPVVVYKLYLLSMAVLASTVIDRLFFKPERKAEPYANVARAVTFLAVVLSLSLGL